MPLTPSTHRLRSAPRNPLSHERFLEVCYAYKALYDAYIASGAELTSTLYASTLKIEREIIWWEQRSAKLRYAAKRQAAYRAATRDKIEENEPHFADDGTDDDGDLIMPSASASASDLPSATQSAIERYKAAEAAKQQAPDTSGYKKSGLV